ncbi:MAG: VOC family protein [bacterium]|nr:VOC family protein [bacterium]
MNESTTSGRTNTTSERRAGEGPNTVLDPIHHIAIQVCDLAGAVRWYTERFRCRVEYEDDTWALLEFGNIHLALVIAGQHAAHFGIVTPEAASYGSLIRHRDGTRSVYIHDPAGNVVEVMDPESL